jgi:integrase
MEHKLAAMLHADVKGHSRLIGDDEVTTLRLLTAHFEMMDTLVRHHGGRIAGLLVANPATRIGRFNKKPAERRQNINTLTREELRFFLDSARQYTPRYYPFLLALARAGLRLGAALALQWGDIDWHGRFMEIQRAYCHRSRKIQSPKNEKTAVWI